MKTKYSLLPLQALRQCAELMTDMEQGKHSEPVWLRMSATEHVNAVIRHLVAWLSGEFDDSESRRSHLVHAACRALMACQQEDRMLPEYPLGKPSDYDFSGQPQTLEELFRDLNDYTEEAIPLDDVQPDSYYPSFEGPIVPIGQGILWDSGLKSETPTEECPMKKGKLIDQWSPGVWNQVAWVPDNQTTVSITHKDGDRSVVDLSRGLEVWKRHWREAVPRSSRESIQNVRNDMQDQSLTSKQSIHQQYPFGVDDGN